MLNIQMCNNKNVTCTVIKYRTPSMFLTDRGRSPLAGERQEGRRTHSRGI